jgi:hypothetical protein
MLLSLEAVVVEPFRRAVVAEPFHLVAEEGGHRNRAVVEVRPLTLGRAEVQPILPCVVVRVQAKVLVVRLAAAEPRLQQVRQGRTGGYSQRMSGCST